MASEPQMVKITFRLNPRESDGIVDETMWAERVDADRFRLANTPFWVRDVSNRDVVFARARRNGSLTFTGVSLRGGHSTCWVALRVARGSEDFRRRWAELEALGCGCERGGSCMFAIDVPPSAAWGAVERMLEAGAVDEVWYYEVAHRGHAHSSTTPGDRR